VFYSQTHETELCDQCMQKIKVSHIPAALFNQTIMLNIWKHPVFKGK